MRLRDVGDAVLELDDARGAETSGYIAAPPTARWWRIAVPIVAVAVGAAAASFVRTRAAIPGPAAVARLTMAAPANAAITVSGVTNDVAVSPDGGRVVYVGGNGSALFARTLDRLEPVKIHEGGLPHDPFFSPDGAWVAFYDGLTALRRVPIGGGPAETICRVTQPAVRAAWGTDGFIVLDGDDDALWRVPATGGEPTKMAAPDVAAGERSIGNPVFLPGERTLLYSVFFASGPPGTALLDIESGTRTIVLRDGWDAHYLRSGHLVFRTGTALRVIAFDAARRRTVGVAAPLDEPIFRTRSGGEPVFGVAENGTLVYVAAGAQVGQRRLVWVGRDGLEEAIDQPVRAYTYPSIAPDGRQAAIDIRDQENDAWIWDMARRTLRRLTFSPGFDQYAVWTPDGRRIVSYVTRSNAIVWQQASGDGSPEELMRSGNVKAPTSISPDGTRLLFREDFRDTGHDVMMLSLDATRQVQPLIRTRFNELNAEISPDGRWVAFESDEPGRYEVFVRPFPDVNAGRWQISNGGGTKPLWARDGRELFYAAPVGAIMSAPIEPGPTFTFRTPVKLFDSHHYLGAAVNLGRTFDVAPDGRFLMIRPDAGAPNTLVVVLHWFNDLHTRVPAT